MFADVILLLLFPAAMAYAAATDLFTMKITNRTSLALMVGFFIMAGVVGMSAAAVTWHVAAGVLVLVVTFSFFSFGWIGGGDAKLAAATALWLGFEHLLAYALYASIIGGLLTLVLLRFRVSPMPNAFAGQDWLARLHRADTGVPYGIALSVAGLMIYPETIWMKALGN